MININFIAADGTKTQVAADEGDSVMATAIANDIDGIIGECGGSMMCATCHCYVDEAWVEAVGPRQDGEGDMLESATSEVKPNSRLSCQIKVSKAVDGLMVHLPQSQT